MRTAASPLKPGSLVSQVVASIVSEIRTGAIRSSERLPSERDYAARLKVSRNTVTAAYAELEQRGAIRRLHGKGSFLCALPTPEENFSWYGKVSRMSTTLDQPVLELLTRRCAENVVYPLSAGTPSLEIFPRALYQKHANRIMEQDMTPALAVAPTEGQWRLREAIARWTGVEPRHVMITAGAQEGIDLIARCLVEAGDSVVVESPTYPGAIQSFQAAGARLLAWKTDWSLMQLEEMLLRYRPKAIFTNPTFQNPTGRVMSQAKRRELLDLAYRYRVPILEDSIYSQTYFGKRPAADSLYTLDSRSQVIALNTFSKILAPGLRIGWVTAPARMVEQLLLIKMRSTLFTCGLSQLILAEFINSGDIESHLTRIRAHHGRLLQAAVTALRPACDEDLLHYQAPGGGLYLWCKVPFEVEPESVLAELDASGVSVAPGEAFNPGKPGELASYFRVCFSAAPQAALVAGLEVVTDVLRRVRRRPVVH